MMTTYIPTKEEKEKDKKNRMNSIKVVTKIENKTVAKQSKEIMSGKAKPPKEIKVEHGVYRLESKAKREIKIKIPDKELVDIAKQAGELYGKIEVTH